MIFIFSGPNFLPEYEDGLDDEILSRIENPLSEDYNKTIERGIFNMKYSDAINLTGTRSTYYLIY